VSDGEARVERARQEARALHRALTAGDNAVARAAAGRFAQLPKFAATPLDELLASHGTVTRRDALDVVAMEAGFAGWAHLLTDCLPEVLRVTMYTEAMSASLNRWFTRYEDAAASREAHGGVLLPYRDQFVVVAVDDVRELGLDPRDPDWERIGRDWVRPADPEARLRLARARWQAMLTRGEPLP
jgi:hypothetical protein